MSFLPLHPGCALLLLLTRRALRWKRAGFHRVWPISGNRNHGSIMPESVNNTVFIISDNFDHPRVRLSDPDAWRPASPLLSILPGQRRPSPPSHVQFGVQSVASCSSLTLHPTISIRTRRLVRGLVCVDPVSFLARNHTDERSWNGS